MHRRPVTNILLELGVVCERLIVQFYGLYSRLGWGQHDRRGRLSGGDFGIVYKRDNLALEAKTLTSSPTSAASEHSGEEDDKVGLLQQRMSPFSSQEADRKNEFLSQSHSDDNRVQSQQVLIVGVTETPVRKSQEEDKTYRSAMLLDLSRSEIS
jgi:hypothetical protein